MKLPIIMVAYLGLREFWSNDILVPVILNKMLEQICHTDSETIESIGAHYNLVMSRRQLYEIDWPRPYPEERIQADIENERLFCLYRQPRILAATVCLDMTTTPLPPEVWHDRLDDPEVKDRIEGYWLPGSTDPRLWDDETQILSLSRLASQEPGAGREIIAQAEAVGRTQGCEIAVGNCSTSNAKLQELARSAGYQKYGRVIYRSPRTIKPDGSPLLVDTTRFLKYL